MKKLLILLLFCNSSLATTLDVCFTPGEKCAPKIVNEISHAQKQILVQAYSFTSQDIAMSLIKAKQKGVDVEVILDKSNIKDKHSVMRLLELNNIPIKIDYTVSIAHNKVMIIDSKTVIKGSYNFTTSAEKRNAENLLIIKDNQQIVNRYSNNWLSRNKVSKDT
jgi:phosphatidylserine/phosphatidylglycerophosphate/cardiolipin synthase-like enzyme